MHGKQKKNLVERGYKKAQMGHEDRITPDMQACICRAGIQSSSAVADWVMKRKESLALRNNVNRDRDSGISLQCCGGVLATVGVVPPLLCVRLEGRGDDG